MTNMLGGITLVDVAGLIRDLLAKLNGDDGRSWLEAFKKFLRKENPWPTLLTLLTRLSTFSASAISEFKVGDHFKVDTSDGAKVKISWLDDNFTSIFGDVTEENVPATTLRIHELIKSSLDAPILKELGDNQTTFLAHLWQMLEKQPNGKKGQLLINGFANIFYVRDKQNTLWAVRVRWHDGGWFVRAYSVEDPLGWLAGDQVVSRDSE